MRRILRFALLLSLLVVTPLAGQRRDVLRLAVAGGPTLNDFEVSGVEWMGLTGLEWRPAARLLVVQVDVRYLTYIPAGREHHLLPEASAQLEARIGPLRPFAGAGFGVSVVAREADNASSLTAHVALGTRFRLGQAVDLRLEGRGRSLDPILDLTAGLSLRLF